MKSESRPRRLLLLRHAKTEKGDPSADRYRSLTARGGAQAQFLAGWLRDSGIRPDVVLCSPARRARQTLEPLAERLGLHRRVAVEEELYGADYVELIGRLRALGPEVGSVMLVGHNPGLHELALALVRAGPRREVLEARFPPGTLAILELNLDVWSNLQVATGGLADLITPPA